jgi:hypothetical protein
MLSVQIEKETIRFKNDLNEITVSEFSANIEQERQIEKILKQADQLFDDSEQLQKTGTEHDRSEAAFLQAEAVGNIARARMMRISQISALSTDPAKTEDFLATTNGIDNQVLSDVYEKINEGFGDPTAFFASAAPVQSFRFDDYKRHGLFRLKRANFHVYDLDSQTVIRDAAATIVGQQIGTFRQQFESNDWKNFARFVAYVARPKKEEFEYLPKRKLSSFIGGRWFERMSPADRLAAYNQRLAEAVESRTPIFERLPLPIAIGIYKYYFFLKKNFPINSKAFTERTSKRRNKQSHIIKSLEPKPASKT